MKIVLFYQPLLCDWNHGNAHFLRGYATELQERGHEVLIYEPARESPSPKGDASRIASITPFEARYPTLNSISYHLEEVDFCKILNDADLVIVHELNKPELIVRIGDSRERLKSFKLLFHDTHHRVMIDPGGIAKDDLSHYDGVLAHGEAARRLYPEFGATGAILDNFG